MPKGYNGSREDKRHSCSHVTLEGLMRCFFGLSDRCFNIQKGHSTGRCQHLARAGTSDSLFLFLFFVQKSHLSHQYPSSELTRRHSSPCCVFFHGCMTCDYSDLTEVGRRWGTKTHVYLMDVRSQFIHAATG